MLYGGLASMPRWIAVCHEFSLTQALNANNKIYIMTIFHQSKSFQVSNFTSSLENANFTFMFMFIIHKCTRCVTLLIKYLMTSLKQISHYIFFRCMKLKQKQRHQISFAMHTVQTIHYPSDQLARASYLTNESI